MTPNPALYDDVRSALDEAARSEPRAALPHLRRAAEAVAELIDESMAESVLEGSASLRSAGAAAGLSENAVGPRLGRTRALGSYAKPDGRVTASGVERARYDAETGTAPPPRRGADDPAPMRFKPRRPTTPRQ